VSAPADVTIAGAGIAGMTAALRLLEAGYSVRVIEASSDMGGKFGAHRAGGEYFDYAWHVLSDWCLNFWDIAATIGLSRSQDFAPRLRSTFLRPRHHASPWPRVATVTQVGSPATFWPNASAGLAHWSDVMLFTYSVYELLCDQSLDREEFLNRVTVNGYLRFLPHMSDIAALLHNELLFRIWAIPSYLISARAYQTHLQLIAPFVSSPTSIVVMKKGFEEGFWAPFRKALARFGPRFTLAMDTRLGGIRLGPSGDRVEEIAVRHGGTPGLRAEKVNALIVAVPHERLLDVLAAPDSAALRRALPRLLDVSKLPSQQTFSLTLAFKRRLEIPGVGDEPVALIEDLETVYAPDTREQRDGLASRYALSFIGAPGTRDADHPSVLSVLASDVDALGALDDDEARGHLIGELHRYIHFDDRDIDWNRSLFQPHRRDRLFVNMVGAWEYRPEVRLTNARGDRLPNQTWRTVGNLYLAGDYCRSQINITSLEGAIHTGIWAAHALSRNEEAAGRQGVRPVAAPRPPTRFDREAAQANRARLDRWAGIAGQRSRLVRDELKAAARRGEGRGEPPRPSRPAAFGATHSTRNDGGETMSEDLSTSPGFSRPIRATHTGWLDQYQSEGTTIALKSGARVPIPLLFWETRALCVRGLVDADAADVLLASYGRRSLHVNPSKVIKPQPGSGRALAEIWAPQYGGTGVGPVQSVYAVIYVAPLRTCKVEHDRTLPHLWWWWYYGNAPLNHEFKRDVWGIPSELAPVETSYLDPVKEVRLLENGRTALRLCFDVSAVKKKSPATGKPEPLPAPVLFRAVARRTQDDGENLVEVRDYRHPVTDEDGSRLEIHRGRGTAVDGKLADLDFKQAQCVYYDGYDGVVKIYTAAGSGVDPGVPADDLVGQFKITKRGDHLTLIQEPKPGG